MAFHAQVLIGLLPVYLRCRSLALKLGSGYFHSSLVSACFMCNSASLSYRSFRKSACAWQLNLSRITCRQHASEATGKMLYSICELVGQQFACCRHQEQGGLCAPEGRSWESRQ